jgi:hypothetical protein
MLSDVYEDACRAEDDAMAFTEFPAMSLIKPEVNET